VHDLGNIRIAIVVEHPCVSPKSPHAALAPARVRSKTCCPSGTHLLMQMFFTLIPTPSPCSVIRVSPGDRVVELTSRGVDSKNLRQCLAEELPALFVGPPLFGPVTSA
jgi:hypothetical protein